MMKLFKISGLMALLAFPQLALSASYEDDRQNFIIEDQGVNKVLEAANVILCSVAAMRPDVFVNQGSYLAIVFEEDCAMTPADLDSESKAGLSTSSAPAGVEPVGPSKGWTEARLTVTRDDNASPVEGRAWTQVDGMSGLNYISWSQTSAPSDSSVNGDIVMDFSTHYAGDLSAVSAIPPGFTLSLGRLVANGSEVKLSRKQDGHEARLAATRLESGDWKGIYDEIFEYTNVDSDANNGAVESHSGALLGTFQFYISKLDKGYCRKLLSAGLMGRGDEPVMTEVYNELKEIDKLSTYAESGLVSTEQCFSTDRTKATRNVRRYGVYTNEGNRLEVENSAFSLHATVNQTYASGEPNLVDVYAYASSSGVGLDVGRALIDENTVFRKAAFSDESPASDGETYNIQADEFRILKREVIYLPLEALDGLTFEWYLRDDDWESQHTSLLGGMPAYREYQGSYNKTNKTFTLFNGVQRTDDYYEKFALDEPLTFTTDDWLKIMRKTGYEEDYVNSMGVWSHDTQLWYLILPNAMTDTTVHSAPKGDEYIGTGVRTETITKISLDELPGKLYCFERCIKSDKVQEIFTAALAEAAGTVDGTSLVHSPYYELPRPNSSSIKAALEVYEVIDDTLVDSDGNELTKGANASAELRALRDPSEHLHNIEYSIPGYDNEGFHSLAKGIWSGSLIAEIDLGDIECDDADSSNTGTKTYCLNKIDGGIITTYTLGIHPWEHYTLKSATTGSIVTIDPPPALYYSVPENVNGEGQSVFGQDAGTRIRLQYGGHGKLNGIPGFVFNTKTGEDLGSYVKEWKDGYRYLSRFNMPDGSVLTHATDATKTYKTKQLDGEEWLAKADGTVAGVEDLIGKYGLSVSGPQIDFLDSSALKAPGDSSNEDSFIGEAPDDSDLINNGKPSVIHGEVIFDPTLTP